MFSALIYISILKIFISRDTCFGFQISYGGEFEDFYNAPDHFVMYGAQMVDISAGDTIMFVDQYFRQKLDHFKPTNENTWDQRYFVNDLYYEKGSPIFLFINGQAALSPKWMKNMQWVLYAKKFNALYLGLEHRFYGKSHPTNDTSVDNLIYLTTEQVLSDIVYFIETMKEKYDIPNGTKWILFGGSYCGTLVAWTRLKYPHFIYGAISSSPVLLAKADFYEYFELLSESIAIYSPKCVKNIAIANKQLNSAIKTKEGRAQISELFRLCTPLKENANDISTFLEKLTYSFNYAVQYNRDPFSITDVCNIMNQKKSLLLTQLKQYAEVNKKFLTMTYQPCLPHEYNLLVKNYRLEGFQRARVSLYQRCTAFGDFRTSSKTSSVFGQHFPISYFIKLCQDVFGTKFNKDFVENAVHRTNMEYGGLAYNVSNVVFTQGSIDPFRALGIIERPKDSPYHVIHIEGTSHCHEIYAPNEHDSENLKSARRQIGQILSYWLGTKNQNSQP